LDVLFDTVGVLGEGYHAEGLNASILTV
jgi:hypothetical protein